MELEGKIVLVTGASKGIGRAIAEAAGKEGATVIVNYLRSEEDAKAVVEAIRQRGGRAEPFKADVSVEAEVGALFKFIKERYGRLDVLVNNAGIVGNSLLMMTGAEEFDRIMAVNCRGSFLCLRAAAKMMARQKEGRIINLASVVGVHGNRGQVAYSGSKAFIIGMTKSAAKELGPMGIRVNAMAPGFIDTDMTRDLKPEVKAQLLGNVALGRPGTPEDVAGLAVFLMSKGSDYINGQVLGVDGGQVI